MAMIGIVPEELTEKNYEYWKVCLRSYLVGQGLWDIVTKDATLEEQKTPEWVQKNALALHAIQLACGSQIYSKYKRETNVSAKFAWDHLANKYHPKPSPHFDRYHVVQDQGHPISTDNTRRRDYIKYEKLYKAVESGDIKATEEYIKINPDATTVIVSSHGDMALHIAILAGKTKVALELVKKMPEEGLEVANDYGATPLSLAAISGETKLAKAMVQRNHKLLTISNGHENEGFIPIIVASMYGRLHMVEYLYSKTPKEIFNPATTNGLDGATLLNNLITADFYDVASMLLKLYPRLGVIRDHHGNYTLKVLAHKPSAFPSGSSYALWKHWIYKCVSVHSPWENDRINENDEGRNTDVVHTPSDHFIDIDEASDEVERDQPKKGLLHELGWILLRFVVPDIKHIHDRKLINDEAVKLLSHIFKEIRGMTEAQLEEMDIDKAIYEAIKHGIVEFIEELLEYNPEFIWRKDKKGRTIFSHAIVLRQEKIFSLIYKLGTKKSIVARRHDIFGNNFLHLAAKLSPPTQLERVSGAALQMQRELQWYNEVESIVQPKYKDEVNENHRKPRTLFTEEHKELAKEGERWMKNTAGSSMIVGTLIAAVMFTTAFTVPGGNDAISGLPIMLVKDTNAFLIFMVSNAMSMFASSTSVLMFLGILTARYAEEDFLTSLPRKLMFGLTCLFFSIVTMMVSFGSSLYLILHKSLPWVSVPIIILSTFPVLLFSVLQFPLLIEMMYHTYWSTLFHKPNNNHTLFHINGIKSHKHSK